MLLHSLYKKIMLLSMPLFKEDPFVQTLDNTS